MNQAKWQQNIWMKFSANNLQYISHHFDTQFQRKKNKKYRKVKAWGILLILSQNWEQDNYVNKILLIILEYIIRDIVPGGTWRYLYYQSLSSKGICFINPTFFLFNLSCSLALNLRIFWNSWSLTNFSQHCSPSLERIHW